MTGFAWSLQGTAAAQGVRVDDFLLEVNGQVSLTHSREIKDENDDRILSNTTSSKVFECGKELPTPVRCYHGYQMSGHDD
eukprot:2168179-Rhodomonas_salina.1